MSLANLLNPFAPRGWSVPATSAYIAGRKQGVLVDFSVREALRLCFEEGLLNKTDMRSFSASIQARRFSVFHTALPQLGAWPWHKDWRQNVPPDEKLPQEIARLWFLHALFQDMLLAQESEQDLLLKKSFQILRDFQTANPPGHAVTWKNTLDVSLRALSLVTLLDMALLTTATPEDMRLLLNMITAHGDWLWRRRKEGRSGDSRFTAQLTALLASGLALGKTHPAASRWRDFAQDSLKTEVARQYGADGVHVEKSLDYHRMATELFLVARLMMERQGVEIPKDMDEKLHAACSYAAYCLRPDGLTPAVGDVGDARLFGFDDLPPRRNTTLFILGTLAFGDSALKKAAGEKLSPVLAWLGGMNGVKKFKDLITGAALGTRYFPDGGVLVVREKDFYFLMDVGTVGRRGHNDLLSFELSIEGHPLIIDPGSPTYTGDPIARGLFRSTAYHNGVVVDGLEIAPFLNDYDIAEGAYPHSVNYRKQGDKHVMTAGHTGYQSVETDVDVLRTVTIEPKDGVLTCRDEITVSGNHKVARYLHFAPETQLSIKERCVFVSLHQFRFEITFDAESQPYLLGGRISNGYGHTAEAQILMLSTTLTKSQALEFTLRKT